MAPRAGDLAVGVPARLHGSGDRRFDAEDRQRDFRPAGADQTGHAENLAAADGERHGMLRIAPGAQPVDPEVLAAALRDAGASCCAVDVAADHQPDHVVVGQLVARQRAGVRAVAQHDRAIGDGPHFAEPVRDVDDRRRPARAETGDDLVQPAPSRRASGSTSARP